MSRFTIARLVIVVFGLSTVWHLHAQDVQIGIIDFYGLSRVSPEAVRQALTFKEGDKVSMETGGSSSLKPTEDRLARLPGVRRARTDVVCCDRGRAIVYVGIEEEDAPPMRFRAAPVGSARLAPDVIDAGQAFEKALVSAVERGDAEEDHSQGHALAHDPVTRAVQERFVAYANRDLAQLRQVLRESSDVSQRALAAQLLAYATDKKAVVDDLVGAMSDPASEVRNNAVRALWVFADAVRTGNRPDPRIPIQPFIQLLNSPVWSDRNKASNALMALSATRDPALLSTLQRTALVPLVEIARWRSGGHALPAFMILARMVGYSDQMATSLFDRGEREGVIAAAMKRQ